MMPTENQRLDVLAKRRNAGLVEWVTLRWQ
jgi:hypothetical protein